VARLLPHLTRELESELIRAVEESTDGYPQHLNDMRGWYESITEQDVDDVSQALWEGRQDGRQAQANEPR